VLRRARLPNVADTIEEELMKTRRAAIALLCLLVLFAAGCAGSASLEEAAGGSEEDGGQRELLVFAGAASKPPTEEIAQLFEQRTGARVDIHFGGSGSMLAEMEIAQNGDVFFPGSSDWMEVAKERNLVDANTERRVVYLVNSINVQAGNPKSIRSLEDLLLPGVRVVIANPESVCVGAYAVEILEKSFTSEQISQFRADNLVNWADSCEKTANAVSLKAADAVIGWSCFEKWDPARIETVELPPESLVRIAYIPIAVTSFAQDKALAAEFIEFVLSDESMAIFEKYGYYTDDNGAQDHVGADYDLPVGGWYDVPKEWLAR
jgi:molybdate transport system substrate-binding protein